VPLASQRLGSARRNRSEQLASVPHCIGDIRCAIDLERARLDAARQALNRRTGMPVDRRTVGTFWFDGSSGAAEPAWRPPTI
jgi:hypothetical protein